MKFEISKEIFIALRAIVPFEHFAFSSPFPEMGFTDRREHFKGPNNLFVDVIFKPDCVEYWLFTEPSPDDAGGE